MDENSDDERTLTPVYRFEWDNGTARETSDPDFTSAPNGASPDAVETLAILGREDDGCDVHLIGMGN